MCNKKVYKFIIYVDGSSQHRKSIGGGTAFLLRRKEVLDNKEFISKNYIKGYFMEGEVTNNQMELMGLKKAIDLLYNNCTTNQIDFNNVHIDVYSDSKYLVNIFNQYVNKWEVFGYFLSGPKMGEEVKNKELIQDIQKTRKNFVNCRFNWVKGHSGVIENELVDSVAKICRHKKTIFSKSFSDYISLLTEHPELICNKACLKKLIKSLDNKK